MFILLYVTGFFSDSIVKKKKKLINVLMLVGIWSSAQEWCFGKLCKEGEM